MTVPTSCLMPDSAHVMPLIYRLLIALTVSSLTPLPAPIVALPHQLPTNIDVEGLVKRAQQQAVGSSSGSQSSEWGQAKHPDLPCPAMAQPLVISSTWHNVSVDGLCQMAINQSAINQSAINQSEPSINQSHLPALVPNPCPP